MGLEDLRLVDLEILLDVDHFGSMNEVAKFRGIQPSTVSKGIRRLEIRLDQRLVARSTRGASLTPSGRELVASIAPLLRSVELWDRRGRDEAIARPTLLAVGAPSVIATHLVPKAHGLLRRRFPDVFVRLVDLRPTESLAAGLSGHFQLIFHWDPLDWPQSWVQEELGTLRWHLYARKGHPLGAGPVSIDAVRQYRFVVPVYWDRHEFVSGDDACPIPGRDRSWGDETETAEAALHYLESSDQIAFLPDLVTAEALRHERVGEVRVEGWPPVRRRLFLSVKADEVRMAVFRELSATVRSSLEEAAGR
jgi:DNA-binding transcriptional LysR family regulator